MAITSIRNIILCAAFSLTVALPVTAYSDTIGFHFTGNVMIAGSGTPLVYTDPSGNLVVLAPISASLDYNTVSGLGGSNLSITMPDFSGSPVTFHDITMQHETGTNLIQGEILVDWNGNVNMPMNIEWDATGLFNALTYGLKPGDTISGTTLKQDTTGDGNFDTFTDVSSATPYSDTILDKVVSPVTAPEGAAPIASTSGSLGLGYDINGNYVGGTPFDGIQGLINIGSGNSLTVTSVSTVPVPAAIWLFCSGLIGLIGISKKTKQ